MKTKDPKAALMKAVERIAKAATKGKGVRLSEEEVRLLQTYNLPCTADNPDE